MDTEQNNVQINTFTEGMNADWAFDNIKNTQYRYALNLRVTNIEDGGCDNSSIKTGIISPIWMYKYNISDESNEFSNANNLLYVYKIVSSGDYHVILYKNSISNLNIARMFLESSTFKFVPICSIDPKNKTYNPKNLSAVLHYESDNVVNLYIADGTHKIIQLNIIDADFVQKLVDDEGLVDINYLLQNNYFPSNKLTILGTTSGQLKTQQVQYTYRFYKKHGCCSQLAPLTNKIQIIDTNRNKSEGNAEDTNTSIGMRLQINTNVVQFDYIQIYRLSYIKPNQNAEVNLIYDGRITGNSFDFIDDGKDSLQKLTLDEFSNLNGLQIIPKVIEQNQNYLFAGNVKDESIIHIDTTKYDFRSFQIAPEMFDVDGVEQVTYSYFSVDTATDRIFLLAGNKYNDVNDALSDLYTTDMTTYVNPYCNINHKYDNKLKTYDYKNGNDVSYADSTFPKCMCQFGEPNEMYLGGNGPFVDWRFVVYDTGGMRFYPAFDYTNGASYSRPTLRLVKTDHDDILTYYNQCKIKANGLFDYNDSFSSSLLRSLKRGEVYRYGIVFFNSKGSRTDVQWIADIRVPSLDEIPLIDEYGYFTSIGIEFTFAEDRHINIFGNANAGGYKFGDFIQEYDIVGYEIVRCAKSDQYTRALSQVATASLVQQNLVRENEKSPMYPTGFLTSQKQKLVYTPLYGADGFPKYMRCAENVPNFLQIYCPEIQIQRKDMLSKLNNFNCKLDTVLYEYTNDDSWIRPKDLTFYKNDNCYHDNSDKNAWGYGWFFRDVYDVSPQVSVSPISFYYHRKYITFGLNYYVQDAEQYYGDNLYIDTHYFDLTKQSKINTSHTCTYNKYTTVVYIYPYAGEISNRNEKIYIDEYDAYLYERNEEANWSVANAYDIESVIDVKSLNWEDGFSNITTNGASIKNAVKKYKSYVSTIRNKQYINWVCSNKYDFPIGTDEEYGWTNDSGKVDYSLPVEFTTTETDAKHGKRHPSATGPIGPSGQCFIVKLADDTNKSLFNKVLFVSSQSRGNADDYDIATDKSLFNIGTLLCDVVHTASQFAGVTPEEMKYDVYYGFGNYFNLDDVYDLDGNRYTNMVFDGDIYVNNCEFVSMFKTYDFNDDKSSLQSLQIVNYIPMESRINQMFDYGMNYRNTQSPNLMLEPGTISGVNSQDRALNQYNLIYSDNNTSNNIYNVSSDEDTVNTYKQRVFYSQLKTNGENIDNWQIFKAADFIDCDSKYGDVTDLYTVDDVLYYWQQYAFGRFFVNERSLVKDENSNSIQLGQGGVLQRCNYISTKYGMREYDMCKIEAQDVVYWFDWYSKAIVRYKQNVRAGEKQVLDYTKDKNISTYIKNLYNYDSDTQFPSIAYDNTNSELLFSPIKYVNNDNDHAIAFNINYDTANSFYSFIKNSNLYGNKLHQYNRDVLYFSVNNLDNTDNTYIYTFGEGSDICNVSDQQIAFMVNKSPSTTKVFDNQQLVPAKCWDRTNIGEKFFVYNKFKFKTDLYESVTADEDLATNREGNICYAIARYGEDYGQRLRGKWMEEELTHIQDGGDFSISHIITKFRQSFN